MIFPLHCRSNAVGLFGLLALWLCAVTAPAQSMISPGASLKKGFAASHYERRGDNKVLQAMFTGESAVAIDSQVILAHRFEMTTFADGDPKKPQLLIRTPECFLDTDPRSHRVYSTNQLQAYTVTTNFYVEGVGFSCAQTNECLIISNSVYTRLPRAANASGLGGLSAGTGDFLLIYSDHLELYYASNLVIYSGNVRVVDSNNQMRCDYLEARAGEGRLGTNSRFESILARDNVAIDTSDRGRITGDRASYWLRPEGEIIEITGRAHWKDGPRESDADKFTYEPAINRLRADGNAAVKIPDSDLLKTNQTGMDAREAVSNTFTELSAGHLAIQLTTNGGMERIDAEDNLLITNHFRQLRATARRGGYRQGTDLFELQGAASMLASNQDEIQAEHILIGRTNRTFAAHGDSRLKTRIRGSPVQSGSQSGDNNDTNRFLSVASEDLDFRDGAAVFTNNVHASVLQGGAVEGTLDSDFLEVRLDVSNRLSAVAARGHVRGATAPQASVLKRTVACDQASATFWPGTDFLKTADADGRVIVDQIEKSKRYPGLEKIAHLNAGNVAAKFATASNQVENAIATRDVNGFQREGLITNIFQGQRVDYENGANPTIALTDAPFLQYYGPMSSKEKTAPATDPLGAPLDERKINGILASGYEAIILELKTGSTFLKGPGSTKAIVAPVLLPDTNAPPSTNR